MPCTASVPLNSSENTGVHAPNPLAWLHPSSGNSNDFFSSSERKGKQVSGRKNHKSVLLLSRAGELALYRAEILRERGFAVHLPRTKEEAIAAIKHGAFDVAILSYTLPSDMVHELAEQIRGTLPSCPLLAISDSGTIDRKIRPDETVIADEGPAALVAALHRLVKRK